MNVNLVNEICNSLDSFADKDKQVFYSKYFKFYPFEQMKIKESDQYKGISVPFIRKVVKLYYKQLSYKELDFFLNSKIHEYKLFALLVLVSKFSDIEKNKTYTKKQKFIELNQIVKYYLKNSDYVNNWDLVDISASNILGKFLFLFPKEKRILEKLSLSEHLWKQRIAIVSTFYLIKQNDFKDILKLSKKFLTHKHHLIHKALGWMLREMGKRNKQKLIIFLNKNYKKMPKIMLQYATEGFTKAERQYYLD